MIPKFWSWEQARLGIEHFRGLKRKLYIYFKGTTKILTLHALTMLCRTLLAPVSRRQKDAQQIQRLCLAGVLMRQNLIDAE